MDEFEVIERIEKAGTGETYILAIEFVKPTMIKFRSTVHLKKGDKLTLNDKEVFHGNDRVGEAFEKKSRDDVSFVPAFSILSITSNSSMLYNECVNY